ncbi:aminotransferase-like domain-containing protein [Amycolatopsis thermophila]|uniref:DNA-binding transcriptional MocR family regulator n=1 Tax=Amycolatopsis thermophila TaxID=206084 RepID=A0ABU0EVV6_9PSEU|nr:PLP-dependent aminotransferase family protein [Amycolatopsis thermophila]MDQ0379015.1 DNA-binding transcriptional MocR family regulator [Amycolatopsis thermophila]
MRDYRAIADAVASDITAGRLRPGDRLPPQRRFARQHRIAESTAARVYGELVRRGLAVGETGRGTFVRAGAPKPESALAEPAAATVDLELNFPLLPEQAELIAASLGPLLRPDVLGDALRPAVVTGTAAAREEAARVLARGEWAPEPGQVLFTGNGRQAIAAAIAALVPAGERLGVEELTYPVVKGIAARLGVTLVPLEMDEHGVLPDLPPRLRAVYLQPALHNPLGVTMPDSRRRALVEELRARDLPAIDDGINGFLRPDVAPLAELAPERTVVLDSLSKRLAPGLSLGFVVAPPALRERLTAAVRSGGWAAARFPMAAATRLMADGTLAKIETAKRADASARQELVRTRLAGFDVRADPRAYHCWWELPEPWRAEMFVAAAARAGIAVTPAAAFAVRPGRAPNAVRPGRAPNAVRLALASPPADVLAGALQTLATLARSSPEDSGIE